MLYNYLQQILNSQQTQADNKLKSSPTDKNVPKRNDLQSDRTRRNKCFRQTAFIYSVGLQLNEEWWCLQFISIFKSWKITSRNRVRKRSAGEQVLPDELLFLRHCVEWTPKRFIQKGNILHQNSRYNTSVASGNKFCRAAEEKHYAQVNLKNTHVANRNTTGTVKR